MSEFSEIQPASQGGRLSGPISVESGRDLAAGFTKAGNAGQKVELFFALAENHPQVAVPAFAEILETKASAPMRALALQGLGRITHPLVKRALASCETEEDLQVLRDIAKEVKGKGKVSSDLTRWSAAWAIEAIGFPQEAIEHIEGGALTDPPRRIRNEIINRKLQEIDRIQRFDSRGELTAEYERHLEFWLYGPTEELFRANSNTRNYQEIVGYVIALLHVRGVELAVDSQNRSIQEAALRIAEPIFQESTEAEQRRLYQSLQPFLSNEYNQDIPLRRLAAVAICNAGSWLSLSAKARAFLICERWQQVEEMGESAVSHLEEVIDRKLLLATSESDISDRQIRAVEAINRIQFADFYGKLAVLAKVLLRPEERVRNVAAHLLEPHRSILVTDVAALLDALLFEYRLDKPNLNLKDFTVPQIDEQIASSRDYESEILSTFSQVAIDATETLGRSYNKLQLANGVKDFLQSKRKTYSSDVNAWLQVLSQQKDTTLAEQAKIQSNQSLLNTALSEIRRLDSQLYDRINSLPNQAARQSNEYETYNQCQKLLPNLTAIKTQLLSQINIITTYLNTAHKLDFQVSPVFIGLGVGTILVTALIIAPYIEKNKPRSYSGNKYSTSSTPWYVTGFPKANGCGSSSSPNNCWYPVFIQYSDSNWSGILANHCGDLSSAQSQDTARKIGKIQIASFNNQQEAQGFANYMKSQYGSGWVGETKCF